MKSSEIRLGNLVVYTQHTYEWCIERITPYIPTQDPMLDRSHILSILNITEQEDKFFQEQYKNL